MEGSDGGTLERERELARIAAALAAAAGGDGQLVVVEGPPGIGKTHLVEAARALAKAEGFGRLKAVGDEPERSLAWGVVRQLVERSILRYSGETRRAILAGPAGAALEALDRAPDDPASTDEAVLGRTLHALWWVAADLAADRPLLITVDDAQWADAASLRFLAYLARRLGDLPIALVVGTRPPGPDDRLLADLAAGRSGERLLPQPLSPAALDVYVAAQAGDAPAAEVVAALHAASGGNPFLAGQLLDELAAIGRSPGDAASAEAVRELGPRTVSRALLARLSPDGHALAGAAAVLGARSDLAAAGELAGLSAQATSAAADELRAGHVMRPEAVALEFVHPVIREAVIGELRPARRAALHASAAERLHAGGAPPGRVAPHLAASLPGTLPGPAVEILLQAAREVLAEGDAAAAAAFLERAVDEAPADPRVAALLGTALLRSGRAAEGRERLRAAVDATGDPVERAERVARASAATLEVDGPAAAAEELRSALDALPADAPRSARIVLESRLAAVCTFLPEERERSGRRLAAFADLQPETIEERQLLALLAQWRFGAGIDAAGVGELVGRALGDGAVVRSPGFDVLVWGQALHAAIFGDGVDVGEAEIAHGRTWLRRRGSPEDYAAVSAVEAFLRWRTGDIARLEAVGAGSLEALELAEPTAFAAGLRAVATRFTALAALERGDTDGAAAVLDAYARADTEQTPPLPHARVGLPRAALALARDEPALALREAEAVGAAEAASASVNPAIAWRALAAIAELRLGREPAARRLAARQLELARRWGAASDIGAALRLAARVGEGDRITLLEEAIATLEDAPARLELAGALCDLGEAMRVERRRREAHAPLESAAALAGTLGAHVLRARAQDSLAALGDRPRKLAFAGTDALTASERRVAELAAAGRSNREIAQELFVTPKTVENHLGRVYVKLGIGGRRELSGVLAAA